MSSAEVSALPVAEKLRLMELLWEDLRSHAGNVSVPDWQKRLLDRRKSAVAAGEEEVLDWDDIKHNLGSGKS